MSSNNDADPLVSGAEESESKKNSERMSTQRDTNRGTENVQVDQSGRHKSRSSVKSSRKSETVPGSPSLDKNKLAVSHTKAGPSGSSPRRSGDATLEAGMTPPVASSLRRHSPVGDRKKKRSRERATKPGAIFGNSKRDHYRDARSKKERNGERSTKPGAIFGNSKRDHYHDARSTKERSGERVTKPGALFGNSRRHHDHDARTKKEQSGAKASKPGAVPEKSSAGDARARKKDRIANRASNQLGAVPADDMSLRERRKESRVASSSSQPEVAPSGTGDALEAVAVEDRTDGEALEQMRLEFERKEKMRQKEVEELNQRLAAKKAKEDENEEARQRRRKRKNIITVMVCLLLLICGGVGAFLALNKDATPETTSTLGGISEDPSSLPSSSGSSNTGKNDEVSGAPTSAASNGPTVTQLYDSPNEEDCQAISNNQTIGAGQDGLEQNDFDMAFDTTLDTTGDITGEQVQDLLDAIQAKLLPPLAGCSSLTTINRLSLMRGAVRHRRLAIDENRFVILFAFVTGREDPEVVCEKTEDSDFCHRIVVKVSVILKGPVQLLDLVFLTFDQVTNILEQGAQDDGNLKEPLGLGNSFSEVRLISIDNQRATPAPSLTPSMNPSPLPTAIPDVGATPLPTAISVVEATSQPTSVPAIGTTPLPTTIPIDGPSPSATPSEAPKNTTQSPSSNPSLAPVSGPPPPPTARPTAMPSVTPSLRPSSVPSSLSPTLAPVAGSTAPPPSNTPSRLPSSTPISQAPTAPSQAPTATTSEVVSSAEPSSKPSMIPSIEPSSGPSSNPSAPLPSALPSPFLSMNPSMAPISPEPSANPTLVPTVSSCFCTATGACDYTVDVFTIGCGACNALESCVNLSKMLNEATIGTGSCTGPEACKSTRVRLMGDDSCTEESSCKKRDISNGDGSCKGQHSCENPSEFWLSLKVQSGSCVSSYSCYSNTVNGDDGSCTGEYACAGRDRVNIGSGSCTARNACAGAVYSAGQPPEGSSAFTTRITVGDNSCQCENCCICMIFVGNNDCNVPGECCQIGDPTQRV